MPTRRISNELTAARSVARDRIDLRDLKYLPSLAVLRDRQVPQIDPKPCWPGFDIRDQGHSGRCVGFALANLVDLQRREQMLRNGSDSIDKYNIVSADMLYFMAAYHDDYPELTKLAPGAGDRRHPAQREGVRTLRSAIKALYHHGVCRDHPDTTQPPPACWQSDCYRPGQTSISRRLPTVAQARAAREISLGAYYRLEPVLNDYHAALNDTNGILVSAQVHRGWRDPFRRSVTWIGDGYDVPDGSHAFVIIGYDAEGFLVLNSWGDGWGGSAGLPGVALWRYADWAETVMDGWVLRLGVSAPDAFDVTVGRQGLARVMGTIRSGSARCHQLIGHYLHFDDGFHVEHGSYPSDGESWANTRAHLETILDPDAARAAGARLRKGILLWIPGSLEGIDPAVQAAVRRKAAIENLDLYPYNVFWCNQFVEKSLELLTVIFESCYARVGSSGPQLDALIEQQLRGVGRAFWRDIEQAARRAINGTPDLPEELDEDQIQAGPVVGMFLDMLDLAASPGRELHIVCEGAGVLVLHELLRHLAHDRQRHDLFVQRIDTLALIHPAIGLPRAARDVLPLVHRLNAEQSGAVQTPIRPEGRPARNRGRQPPRARIYLPSSELEERLEFGVYSGSLLKLVSRSFEDRLAQPPPKGAGSQQRPRTHPSHPPRPFLGTTEGRTGVVSSCCGALAFSELTALKDPALATGRVSYGALLADPLIDEEIFRTIRELRAARPA